MWAILLPPFAFGRTMRRTRAPNCWRIQSPGWAYVTPLDASSGWRVTGSPWAGCQPGPDLRPPPAYGADSDFQQRRKRPFTHLAVYCAASKCGTGAYFPEAQEAIGVCCRHDIPLNKFVD